MNVPLSPRQPFKPIKPDSPVSSPGHAKNGSVSKLRSAFESPSSSPQAERHQAAPLTQHNLSSYCSVENADPQQHVIRAKMSAGATPRRKQALLGAERVSRPLSSLSISSPVPKNATPAFSPPLHAHQASTFSSPNPAGDPFSVPSAVSSADPIADLSDQKDTVVVCVRVKPTSDPSKDAWDVDPQVAKLALTQTDKAGSSFNFGLSTVL